MKRQKMQKIVLGIVIHPSLGYVFHLRNKNPYKNMIGLVGGKVEKEEKSDQAIVREIEEEIGLNCKKVYLEGIVKEELRENDNELLNYFFIYKVYAEGKIKNNHQEGKAIIFSSFQDINNNKKKFIPLDFLIFNKYLDKNLSYHHIFTTLNNNKITIKENFFGKKKCVVIGSFRKHIDLVNKVINIFLKNNIYVLSPERGSIINPKEEFVLFDYDPPILNEGEIQAIVLKKMHLADFIYLVNPDGYLGKSAAFEIGYAFAHGFKVFSYSEILEMHRYFINKSCLPEEIIEL